jgi:catalase-peroxidase
VAGRLRPLRPVLHPHGLAQRRHLPHRRRPRRRRHGQQRFAPLNSWPDNGNLDKARRLLWPIKQKYGNKLSWADLMILAGNVALESMGFKTFGFGGGRADVWEPEEDIYWGTETEVAGRQALHRRPRAGEPARRRADGPDLREPGRPERQARPARLGRDIRETFARMAMNDEETVALVAGGHTFGKAHGAGDPAHVGPEPEGAPIEAQGLGWKNSFGSGKGGDTITSGIEGAWTTNPTSGTTATSTPVRLRVGTDQEPGRRPSVDAEGRRRRRPCPTRTTRRSARADDDHRRPGAALRPGLREDLAPLPRQPEQFADAFARAWFKLTHRDMGPRARYLGPEVPAEELIWQDPVPAVDHPLVDAQTSPR